MSNEHNRVQNRPLIAESSISAAEWEAGIEALGKYVLVRGSAPISRSARANGFAVGAWTEAQRGQYWAGRLDSRRIKALECTPGWTWNGTHQRRWHQRFLALARYTEKNSTAEIGLHTVVDHHLGMWAAKQRSAYAAGNLPDIAESLLESLPGWRWTAPRDQWEVGLETARRYAANHDTLDIAEFARADYIELSRWIRRSQEKYRSGDLSPKQVAALKALPGWRWQGQDRRWGPGWSALCRYAATHRNASPHQDTIFDDFPLGRWVHDLRRLYRLGSLPHHRIELLEGMPGWTWSVFETAWQRGLSILMRYVDTHPLSTLTSGTVVDGFALGEWADVQRRRYRHHRLTARRIEHLEAVAGWSWNLPDRGGGDRLL